MGLKDWKKGLAGTYIKDKYSKRSRIDFRYSRNNKGYFVIINDRTRGKLTEDNRFIERFFKTKLKALAFAKAYMRKH